MTQASMPENILRVGEARLEAWGPADSLQVVGKSLPKRSGFDKVTGRARYAFDVQLPGMLSGVSGEGNGDHEQLCAPPPRLAQG